MSTYLIKAGFDIFNFGQFNDEYSIETKYKPKNSIIWGINEGANNIKKDSTVYIYYYNMPDLINRCLIKAKISEIYTYKQDPNGFKKLYKDSLDDRIKTNGKEFILSNIEALNPKNIHDFDTRTLKDKKKYGFNAFKGPIVSLDKYQELENALEECSCIPIRELLEKYIYASCYFSNKNKKDNHNTFIKDNGSTYLEYHHFFLRALARNEENDFENENKDIYLNSNYNYYQLCPTCHRKIHWGEKKDRKKMVDDILQDIKNDKNKLNNANIIAKKANRKDIKELAYELYNLN